MGQYPDVDRFTSGTPTYSKIGSIWGTSTTVWGNVSGRSGDTAVYRLTGGRDVNMGSIYVGVGNTSSGKQVERNAVLPVGYEGNDIYTSGASGFPTSGSLLGQITPDWVSLDNQCTNYANGQNFCGITIVEDASECVSGGDSGGAVYRNKSNGKVDALGIISGANYQGVGPTNCRNYYTPTNRFFHTSYGLSTRINGS